jgi:predicted O-methyltransferase YrrM
MALPLKKRLRRFRMAAQTALGWGAQGFFTPYRYAASARPATGYPEIERALEERESAMVQVLDDIERLSEAMQRIGHDPAPAPRWDQGWFATLDAAAAYTLVHRAPPRKIIEVGSGHSTRFLARALKDAGAEATHVCIDPQPRADLLDLPVTWEKALLSDAHLAMFDGLESGDVAFFDSSHILWPGLDVDLIFNRILPRLKPGVLVHIHDVFLPDPYPDSWDWRGYTEQNGLSGWFMGGAYEVVFASHYATTRLEAAARIKALPRHELAIDSSFWMVRTP